MKKIFTLLTVLLVFSMILVACGPDNNVVNNVDNNVVDDTANDNADDTADDTEDDEVVVVPPTTRKGGWLDQIAMSITTADAAVTQIEAGAIDIYAAGLTTLADAIAIDEAGLDSGFSFGIYYELTLNPAGDDNHLFPATGKLNPFDIAEVREAMQWLVDRQYIDDEIYGGKAVPKWTSLISGFPEYGTYIEYIRPFELKYQYDYDKALGIITAQMEAAGAVLNADGVWAFPPTVQDADTLEWAINADADIAEYEVVGMKLLVRTDSDGTRKPMGEYVGSQLEKVGFAAEIQYGTSSELSPLWTGDPDRGVFNLYTGAWGATRISLNNQDDFYWFGTPEAVVWIPLHGGYTDVSQEYQDATSALANGEYANVEERAEMFKTAIEGMFEYNYRIWIADGVSLSTWVPELTVAYDLGSGVDTAALWARTLRWEGEEGGTVNWGTPDLFVDPPNPIGGSNWTYDHQWIRAIGERDFHMNPHTGIPLPNRIATAEVWVPSDVPYSQTYDWVTANLVDELIDVPGDTWVDWDAEAQDFITADEKFPDGLQARKKVVVSYPADIFETITWHDGSPFSMGDFLMPMVMYFVQGTPGDPLFDAAAEANLASSLEVFKGYQVLSVDPPTFAYYTDSVEMVMELNVGGFWPDYDYGEGAWHTVAVGNLGEAAQTLTWGKAKADELEVTWVSLVAGPSLELLDGYLDEAIASSLVPFPNVFGDYVTAEEAAARYTNLKAFYGEKDHFWVGTGPYILDTVFAVEKTLTLVHNPNHVDLADKWSMFAEPKLADVDIEGPGVMAIGSEGVFDVYVSYAGEAYPGDEVKAVKYLLFNAAGEMVEVDEGVYVDEGHYTITLYPNTTGDLEAGANRLEIIVSVIPVSIPTFSTFEFVSE